MPPRLLQEKPSTNHPILSSAVDTRRSSPFCRPPGLAVSNFLHTWAAVAWGAWGPPGKAGKHQAGLAQGLLEVGLTFLIVEPGEP